MSQLTFLLAEPRASRSASPESGLDWMTRAATSRLNTFDWLNEFMPSGCCSRTYPASSPAGARPATTSQPFSQPLPGLNTASQQPAGETLASPRAGLADGASRGVCLTLSISEWPSAAAVSSLSDVVETGDLPQRYYLSPKACAGILRRAEKRGKTLPPLLMSALVAAARISAPPAAVSCLRDSEEGIAPDHSLSRPA